MSIFCDLLVGDSRMAPVDSWDWPQAVYGECAGCGAVIPDDRVMLCDALLCTDCEREVYGSCGQREDAG